ncbi:MAG: heavy metal-binding domain-containing protein, partial [Gammaproteobacteria bacterium]|nr:heavy metal-binding domain-containing protein [Gammaproteobacteria bacterium]
MSNVKFSKLVSDRIAKQVILALIVLAVGLPLNYYMYALMQKKDANADTGIVSSSNSELALLKETKGDHEHASEPEITADESSDAPHQETALEHAAKHADPTYVCPMHPEIVSKDPEATCPICGMDLVVMENLGDADVVSLSSNVINALGVRTQPVKRRNIYRRINSVGYVSVDEKNIRRVTL